MQLSQLTCLSFPERLLQAVRSHVIGMLGTAVVFTGRWHVESVWKLRHFTIKAQTIKHSSSAGGPSRRCRLSSVTPQPLLLRVLSLSLSLSPVSPPKQYAGTDVKMYYFGWLATMFCTCVCVCACACVCIYGAIVPPNGLENSLL